MRLDKYLKVSRLIKRRELAKQMIDLGLVSVNDKIAKPSTNIHINDHITITTPANKIIKVKVLEIKDFASVSQASSLYEIEDQFKKEDK